METEPEHIKHVAKNMRDEDVQEIWYASGKRPLEALEESCDASIDKFTVLLNDEPVMIFGVVQKTLLSQDGIIWLLGTGRVNEFSYTFLKNSRNVVEVLMENKRKLCNYVWAGNEVSINWLKWLGFTISASKPYGLTGAQFHYFEKRN